MPKLTGLRTEILTTITLLMGAALLLGGVLMLRMTEQSLLEQKVAQLRLLTAMIASSLADNFSAEQQASASSFKILKQLPEELLLDGWWLYGADLNLLASYSTGEGEPYSATRRQQIRLSGQSSEKVEFPTLLQIFTDNTANVHFLLPVTTHGRFGGLLEIRYSLEDIRYRLLMSQRIVLFYVLLYGAVLVLIGYYLLQRNIISPARNLLQATEAVSRGDLETRLPVAGPHEIARLADAYNHMVEALQVSRRETQTHIETLEQTNQELQRTRDELIRSEKLASVGQLAAGLAHELGNPLAALIGYLEVLKGRLQDADSEVVSRSLLEAERIDFLVRELLDFSRPSELSAEILDPFAVLRSAVSLLEHQGVFGGIALDDQLPESLGLVKVNSHKLQQLFINLLLNAIYACREAGRIILTAHTDEDSLCLSIADTGCGIEKQYLGKIFDPFYTSKAPGEGTGLGLSICHRISEEVGGQIYVESEVGQGSCFRVVLPKID